MLLKFLSLLLVCISISAMPYSDQSGIYNIHALKHYTFTILRLNNAGKPYEEPWALNFPANTQCRKEYQGVSVACPLNSYGEGTLGVFWGFYRSGTYSVATPLGTQDHKVVGRYSGGSLNPYAQTVDDLDVYFICNRSVVGTPVYNYHLGTRAWDGKQVVDFHTKFACPQKCKFAGERGIYDFGRLVSFTSDYEMIIPDPLNPVTVAINLCVGLSYTSHCNGEQAGCVKGPNYDISFHYSLGNYDTIQFSSLKDKNHSTEIGVTATFEGGSVVQGIQQQMQVDLICNQSAGIGKPTLNIERSVNGLWLFEWPTQHACPIDCIFIDETGLYDFSQLANLDNDYSITGSTTGPNGVQFVMYVNMCTKLISTPWCRPSDSIGCIIYPTGNIKYAQSIGSYSTKTLKSASDIEGGVIASFSGGQGPMGDYSMQIHLICDDSIDIGYPVLDSRNLQNNTWMLTWRTKYACPTPLPSTSTTSSPTYSSTSSSSSPLSSSSSSSIKSVSSTLPPQTTSSATISTVSTSKTFSSSKTTSIPTTETTSSSIQTNTPDDLIYNNDYSQVYHASVWLLIFVAIFLNY